MRTMAAHRTSAPPAIRTERDRVADLLAELPVIAALPSRVRGAVVDRAIIRTMKRGAVGFWQGDPASYLTVVLEGFFKGVINSPSGREVVIAFEGPGDMPCWPDVLHDARLPMTLSALQDTKVARLPITPIRHCISAEVSTALAYSQLIARQHRRLLDQVVQTRAASVPDRLGGLIQHLHRWYGTDGGLIPMRLTRQDLADAAGTTVETTIRLMRKWEKAGVVETHRDGIRILDIDGFNVSV